VDGEDRQAISDTFQKFAKERDDSHRRRGDVGDNLEAPDGIIAGLREQITGKGTELEKKLAEQTHVVAIFAEQAVQMKERLQVAERKAGEAEEQRRQRRSGRHGWRRRHR